MSWRPWRAHRELIGELEAEREALLDSLADIALEALNMLGPEEGHHVYKMLRLRVLVHKDTTLEVSGAFGDDLALCSLEKGTGFPIGPFELGDLIGLDVGVDVLSYVHDATGDAYYMPPRLPKEMVEAGRLGRKTGYGFYKYHEGS